MKQSFLFLFMFLITVIPFHANADLLNSAVRIKAQIPEKAHTSKFLGKEREGSGIVIDDEGHVLTIGYLVLEAGSVEITDVDGRVIAAAVEGYDGDSGFGLLKALSPLQARPLRLSDSSEIQSEERLRVVSSQDDTVVQQVVVLERGTFAGYWEYLLENAIFTVPAVNAFAGAGLVNEKGELVGIGSLFLKRNFQSTMVPSNMFVPTEALLPILDDLKRLGRSSSPPRPWLGVTVVEQYGRVLVQRVSSGSPAMLSGIGEGDLILKVGNTPVKNLEGFFRSVWSLGHAGVKVPLTLLQGNELKQLDLISADRNLVYRTVQYD